MAVKNEPRVDLSLRLQIFKTYPNRDLPSPGKTPPNFRRFSPKIYPLTSTEMTPIIHLLIESKRTLCLKNWHILTSNCNSHESCLASKKTTPFLCFSCCACVQHYLLECPPPWLYMVTVYPLVLKFLQIS